MLTAIIDIHRNILSAQCYVKFDVEQSTVNNMQIIGTHNKLKIFLFKEDELKMECQLILPEHFFIPNSISKGTATSLIEIDNESFKIIQKSHYFKYRKVIERHLEVMSEESPTDKTNYYKRLKVNNSDIVIDKRDIDFSDAREIDYSEYNLSVDDAIYLNFRVQISSDEVIPEINSISPLSTYRYLISKVECNEFYEAVCYNCNSLLTNSPIYFEEIKEYCSNFADMSESWFCHKNVNPQMQVSNKTLYVSDMYIYLDTSIVKTFLVNEHNAELKCKNCDTFLTSGASLESNNKQLSCFFVDAILWKKTSDVAFYSRSEHNKSVLVSLLTVVHQKTLPVCRLFFQSKVECKDSTCLLMWISKTEITQFKFQSAVEKIMSSTINFKSHLIHKVQYYAGNLNSPLVKSWIKDFGVDFYKVSDKFMTTMISHLKSNAEYIAFDVKTNDSFSHSCIPSIHTLDDM